MATPLRVLTSPTLAKNPTTVQGRLAVFKEYLDRLELMPRTTAEYLRRTANAEWWCEQHGYTLRNVPSVVLGEYVALLPKSHSSRVTLRATLVHYWRCFKRKDPPVWMVKIPRKPKMACKALAPDEATALSVLARERGGKEGAAVLLAMYQGLRREEISAVAWHDITADGWLRMVGKGDQPASLPLHPLVAEALAALPREHPVWVFPGRPFKGAPRHRPAGGDRHANVATVWSWVTKLAEEAGIGHVPPHRLRHTRWPRRTTTPATWGRAGLRPPFEAGHDRGVHQNDGVPAGFCHPVDQLRTRRHRSRRDRAARQRVGRRERFVTPRLTVVGGATHWATPRPDRGGGDRTGTSDVGEEHRRGHPPALRR